MEITKYQLVMLILCFGGAALVSYKIRGFIADYKYVDKKRRDSAYALSGAVMIASVFTAMLGLPWLFYSPSPSVSLGYMLIVSAVIVLYLVWAVKATKLHDEERELDTKARIKAAADAVMEKVEEIIRSRGGDA